jgi:hypothetical protein
MRKLAFLIGILLIFTCRTGAWADIYSGSLSTSILFDLSDYTKPPTTYENRTPVVNPPGGLTSTAAWDQYGMRLDWSVTNNPDNTYTYNYYFGPGWFPPDNGTKSNPWVTNKQITAMDLQAGAGLTMSDISDLTWSVYNYNNTKLGYGTATEFTKISNSISGSATVVSVGDLHGEIGNGIDGYSIQQLFHGLQWLNPMDPTAPGNFLYPDAVNIVISFTSTVAPGWGNFFANSTQTGSERDYEDVVAYNPFNSNTVSTPGGAPVPVPAAVYLFGSGLGGIAIFRRRKMDA